MSADERTIIIDDSRLAKIENIGRKTKTKFTKWEDFVTETIGMYLNWWINPLRASVQFQKMVPHMTDEMRNNIKEMMSGDEYAGLTETLQEDIANLADIDLPYHEDEVGDKRFEIDSTRFEDIQDIIKQDKVKIKIPTVQIFCDYALAYFVTLWTEPKKSREKIFEIWPYIPADTKNQWKEQYPNSYEKFNKQSTDFNKDNNTEIKLNNYEKITDEKITDEKITDEKITDEKSSEAYNRLCEKYELTKNEIENIDIPKKPSRISLPHDGHPLISSFYSRFFPIKISVAVLAQMMVERNEKTVKYDDFRKEAYDVAVYVSNRIREYEERHGKKRNEKKSTGLPYPLTGSDAAKIASSKERFREHFVGMKEESWVKRQEKPDESRKDKGLAHFNGALNAMELAYVEVTKGKQPPKWNKDLKEYTFEEKGKYDFSIGLTQKGLELYLYKNEIFNKNSEKYRDKMFSKEESDFIFDKIIGEFELEKELVKNALAIITKNSKTSSDKKTRTKKSKESTDWRGEYLDEKLETTIKAWIQKHREDEEKYKNIFNVEAIENTKPLETIRAAIMGRLVEINKVSWEIEEKTSSTLYSLP